jgi:chromosomal replication initiation ATPase DnaA
VTPEQLTDATAFLFGVQRADMLSQNRTARVVQARQALAWALRQNDWSLESIGAYLHRDHTTIIHALKIIERDANRNQRLAERLDALRQPAMERSVDWPARIRVLEATVAELKSQLAILRGES